MERLKKLWYLILFAIPLTIYPFLINGQEVDLRKIRELAFYSFTFIICSFLQKNIWLRLLLAWCVVNWWLTLFPLNSYMPMTNILCALVIYIGIKELLRKKILSVKGLTYMISFAVIFQFLWVVMQRFGFDPIFSSKDTGKALLVGWCGNSGVMGMFFAMASFLLLNTRLKWLFPLMILPIAWSQSLTAVVSFILAGVFYLAMRHKYLWLLFFPSVLSLVIFRASRLPIYLQAIDRIKIRPFIGNGLGSILQLGIMDGTTLCTHVHSEYLQMILTLGLVGFILFAVFIIGRFIFFIRNCVDLILLTCLVSFLISANFWFPMHLAQLGFYAILIWSILEYSCENLKEEINV